MGITHQTDLAVAALRYGQQNVRHEAAAAIRHGHDPDDYPPLKAAVEGHMRTVKAVAEDPFLSTCVLHRLVEELHPADAAL